jgi:flagellar basal-body rod protein FlgF
MEGPTYVTLSAQVALQKQLDVVANNIANASTTGFKADRQLFQTYVDRLQVPGGSVAFVQDRATYIDRSSGPITHTDNPLDIAIQGDGMLAVSTPQGTQYTRDGHLHLGPDQTLVDGNGHAVLDDSGQPIQLPQDFQNLTIRGDGSMRVWVNGASQELARIGTFRANDPLSYRKTGDGMLTAPANGVVPIDAGDAASSIVQGALEGSTVKPVLEIANMTDLSRAYERLQTLISDDNDRERQMIQALGAPTA